MLIETVICHSPYLDLWIAYNSGDPTTSSSSSSSSKTPAPAVSSASTTSTTVVSPVISSVATRAYPSLDSQPLDLLSPPVIPGMCHTTMALHLQQVLMLTLMPADISFSDAELHGLTQKHGLMSKLDAKCMAQPINQPTVDRSIDA
jgi:hypothetical protein